MTHSIWIRGDSTWSGSNFNYNQRASYLLSALIEATVHDNVTLGMMICRRGGFPHSPFSAGIHDFAIPCMNVDGEDKICFLGTNDYDNGHPLYRVLQCQRIWADYVKKHGGVPWIVSPLITSNEGVDRPRLAYWRSAMQEMAEDRGYKYIDGSLLLDIENEAYWLDGVHPSVAGTVELVNNFYAAVVAAGGFMSS